MFSKINQSVMILALSSSPALADQFGTVTATYNGEVREWYTIAMTTGGQQVASADVNLSERLSDVHIQGHPHPSYSSKDVLSIDAMYIGRASKEAKPTDVEIIHLPEGMTGEIWTSAQAPNEARIGFDVFAGDGEVGQLMGKFEAQLCRKTSLMEEPDTSDCRLIEVTFDTKVLIEN